MKKELDIEEVLARNPRIDREQLEKSLELLRRLRAQGLQPKGYDLVRRRAVVQEDAQANTRLVGLRTREGAQ